MKPSSRTTTYTYTIYAITAKDEFGDNVVYIGKTKSKNPKRVLRYHREGHNKLTADDFKKDTCHSLPTIHILEILEDSNAFLAYRYQLAWHRHADESGYITLASETLDRAAYRMSPETEALYQQIARTPFSTFLTKPYTPSSLPPAQESKPSPPVNESQKPVQLNIRITAEERNHFIKLCNDNSVSQREAFSMLLSGSSKTAAMRLIKQQRSTIEEYLRTIDSLRSELKRASRGANADIRLKKALSFCKEAITHYIELTSSESAALPQPLKCYGWNQFSASFRNRFDYNYPADDGFSVATLDAICYGHGRHPAIFVWGTDVETGAKIKVRFYAKRDYIGISFPHSPFVYKNATLLIGYRVAPDNAVDLYFALPLISQSLKIWSTSIGFVEGKRPSLDELIRRSQALQK